MRFIKAAAGQALGQGDSGGGSTLTMPSTGVSYAAAYSDIAGKEVTIITATWTDTETDNISFKDIQVSYVGSGGTTKTVNLTSVFADSRNYDTETYVPITASIARVGIGFLLSVIPK